MNEMSAPNTCNAEELQRLESIKYYSSYQAGQPIVWAGDRLEFVASMVSGTATIEHLTDDGRKQTLGLLLASDFIGRPGRDTAPYDVTAVTDVTLCCFRRKQFEDWMFLLGRKTAREKIASLLLLIARRTEAPGVAPVGNSRAVELPLTRDAMSDYLGLTLETVSRQFSKLKADGVIRLDGKRKVILPDIERLKREAGDGAGDGDGAE